MFLSLSLSLCLSLSLPQNEPPQKLTFFADKDAYFLWAVGDNPSKHYVSLYTSRTLLFLVTLAALQPWLIYTCTESGTIYSLS